MGEKNQFKLVGTLTASCIIEIENNMIKEFKLENVRIENQTQVDKIVTTTFIVRKSYIYDNSFKLPLKVFKNFLTPKKEINITVNGQKVVSHTFNVSPQPARLHGLKEIIDVLGSLKKSSKKSRNVLMEGDELIVSYNVNKNILDFRLK